MFKCTICGCEIDAKRGSRSRLCEEHYGEYRRRYNSDFKRNPLTAAQKQRKRDLERRRQEDPNVRARRRDAVNRSRAIHKGKYAAKRAEWRKNNPEAARAKDKKYKEKNQAKRSAAYKKWRKGKEKELAAAVRQWKLDHPERARAMKRASDIKRKTQARIGGSWPLTGVEIREMLAAQNGLCAYYLYCHTEIAISSCHVDHRLPLARGGTSEPSNLQLTCPSCNLRKGVKTHEEFIARLQG